MITELFLAQRFLFRGRARHISFIGIVSCLGIALGVATLIIVISVMNGFDRDLTDRLLKFNYHLIVESTDYDRLGQIGKILEHWEEVDSASIFLQTQVFAKFENVIIPLVVKGIDFNNKSERGIFYKYVKEVKSKEGFFVGQGLHERFLILDELEFYPLVRNLKLKKKNVRGYFKVGLYDIDNNYLITDLEDAKALSPNYLLFLGLRIKDPFKADEVKGKIIEAFRRNVFVNTWTDTNQMLFSALKLEKITMFIILSLIILVAAFNIFAILTVGVVEKTKDIGILKSLGFASRRILNIFTFQGMFLGFIGTTLGAAIGLAICILVQKYPFIKLPEEIYYIEYLPMAINYRDTFVIVCMGFFLSYVFSLFPAIKASRLSPSEALRYE